MRKGIKVLSTVLVFLIMATTISFASSKAPKINFHRPVTSKIAEKYMLDMEKAYPDLITVEQVGESVDKKPIYLLKLGKGDIKVYIDGSNHARERITTNIILKNIEEYTEAYYKKSSIKGYNVRSLLDKVTIYFIPMLNPDGVDYTILGSSSIQTEEARKAFRRVVVNPASAWHTPGLRWKANIRGVDLNRNFPGGWNQKLAMDIGVPADAHFKGFRPESEPELIAARDVILYNPFEMHLFYHTQGLIFYWYNGQEGNKLTEALKLRDVVRKETGFRPTSSTFGITSYKPGPGFQHFAVDNTGKQAFTMEFAFRAYSESDFDKIYAPGRTLALAMAQEAIRLNKLSIFELYLEDKLIQNFREIEDANKFIERYIKEDSNFRLINKNTKQVLRQGVKPLEVTIVENGEEHSITIDTIEFDNITYTPVRKTFDSLGYEITWERINSTVHLNKEGVRNIVLYTIDTDVMIINEEVNFLWNNAIIRRNGSTYIDVRVLEVLNQSFINNIEN